MRGIDDEDGVKFEADGARLNIADTREKQCGEELAIGQAAPKPGGNFFEQAPNGRIHVGRKQDYATVTFDGSAERWEILAAGLLHGKVRAVVSTLARRGKGVPPERVLIEAGQMKLMYVLQGKVALSYNGERHLLEAGDSAYLDGGIPHGWENVGTSEARTLWVITGKEA